MSEKSKILITGASSGIGAVYADRFARRGHDLVLVARDAARLNALAGQLRAEAKVEVETLVADLTNADDLTRVENRLRDDQNIEVLVNNAGAALEGNFLTQSTSQISSLISLNVTALARLSSAVAPRFVAAGKGAIINIGSVVGVAPEFGMTVYGATKAFVLYLSQGLQLELGPKGVYVQAVLPAATRTDIWAKAGVDVNTLAGVMDTDEMVDAALVGFDRKEAITIPPLPAFSQWEAFDETRRAMLPNFRQTHAAERYRKAA